MNDKISTESVEPEPCFACDLPTVLMKHRWENTPSDPGPLGVDEWYEGGALLCMTSSGTTSRGRSFAILQPPNAAAIELAAYAECQTRTPILEVVEHSG